MKIVLHPADENACGSYRLIWPGQALADQGHDVRVEHDFSYRGVWRKTIRGEVLVNLDEVVRADVIVFQRPLHRHRFELIQILQSKGVAVVVEVDDDFHAVHKRNAAWPGVNILNNADHHRDWLAKSCEIADLVTVSTPALAQRYGAHGRVAVIPNCIPEWYLNVGAPDFVLDSERAHPVVGWSGSTATHPGDLEVTKGALAEFNVQVVGTGKGVKRALKLAHNPEATGWLPLADYPRALSRFDVGVVPLKPGAFNSCKSALKMLEMAAVGVPSVGSPTPDNVRVHRAGIGELAETPDEWRSKVGRLVRDAGARYALAERSREVAREMTIEANAWKWYHAWQWALSEHLRGNTRSDRISAAK